MMETETEEYVRRVVDEAPPLTPEQRDRIAALLRERRSEKQLPVSTGRAFEALEEVER